MFSIIHQNVMFSYFGNKKKKKKTIILCLGALYIIMCLSNYICSSLTHLSYVVYNNMEHRQKLRKL